MDRRQLPLSALRAFEAAAQTLHLGKAGEQLGVTHGAISHQIRALEEQLGVVLFSRANNRMALTAAGISLYDSVRDGFDLIADGARHLSRDKMSGTLHIACTQTMATCWATKHICEFSEHYPNINIRVSVIDAMQTQIPKDIDIALCYGKPMEDERQLSMLVSPPLYPVCSPTLLNKIGHSVSVHRLVEQTLIHEGHGQWSRWLEQYKARHTPVKNIYFSNTSQAIAAASQGYGIALANSFETLEFIKNGQLVHCLNKPLDEPHNYYILRQHDAYLPLKVRLFEEWIMRALHS